METWKRVAQVGDISPDTNTLRVVLDGEGVCLYDLQGEICATQDRCPHGNASLADGYLEDGTIECPLHQGVFDIRSGKPKCPPVTTDLRRYEVKVDGDVIYLKAEAA
ncbi:non-heme iron oxygenase ferredoxin subunit [Achromobacter sp. Marseille-Q0513]|jgi:nitrite reductase/ring-hydroxylating ferredoxin subunit|uniref:non-heme iron oxygenase ferredoxin subunit n=1 Tax=unclassified Achromobacter TaxID=2626865 RepID=UPI000CD2541E|nr:MULTISPECIES: non-heme iron oxygenase ferredoxin subunit [unclassified Achromobacter]AUT48082.1 ferredoxin [Achromobacter sp. AONIH1]MBR8655838.1 non-heme iron oxygenase ferredoxin subunit [Achromobacter sp. Marseille-Q0513]